MKLISWTRLMRSSGLLLTIGIAAGCGGGDDVPPLAAGMSCAAAAQAVAASNPVPGTTLRIATAVDQAASGPMPANCLVEGSMNERISAVDGRPYAVKFRMRMPQNWNEKFFMPGGGGTNGTLSDASGLTAAMTSSAISRGYAVIVTDSGHDNAVNTDPANGSTAAFGLDPQARLDFGYNSYDVVTQLGKVLVRSHYGKEARHSYFVGCSEGGREASMMSQRFPHHYDGIVAGCPAMNTPIMAAYSSHLGQVFAPLATQMGHVDADGRPLINKVYTDNDIQLVSTAILSACDGLDGVVDGMSSNVAACTDAVVVPQLNSLTCAGPKTDACLTAAQIVAMREAFAGPRTSDGVQLYPGNPWDPGIGGMNGAVLNQGFRSWWLGTYNSATNNAIKMTLSSPLHAMVYTTPPVPLTNALQFDFELNFNRDEIMANATRTTPLYTVSAVDFATNNSTDLWAFRDRGGKLIVWIGVADPAVSANETIDWYRTLDAKQSGRAGEFARLFLVPGMNHGSGGPATDRFDMLAALEDWVERGQAPEQVTAEATTPAYFGVAARTRPLCPYPRWARYNGSGDVNSASSFTCTP